MEQLSIFSPEDSHVSHFLVPGSKEARKMTVISGRKCYGLYQKYARLGSLVKMLLGSSTWHSTKCYLTWKTRATPANRLLFQLAAKMPHIKGIGCGLWQTKMLPTPRATDWKSGGWHRKDRQDSLTGVAKYGMLPTMTVNDSKKNGTESQMNRKTLALNCVAKMIPTPTAPGKHQVGVIGGWGGSGNPLRTPETMTLKGGALNPQWVEWLMGYPQGWTDLNHSETP